MDKQSDRRIVLTLDAGGTNFVFHAVRDSKVLDPGITLSARKNSLEQILNTIIEGFDALKNTLNIKPVAISFAFPGPSDFHNGIIGDLQNLPLFRGGVALKHMLEEHFGVPTFISNDGDLFTYGEAKYGFLPKINKELEKAGREKRYKNLLGITLGTGTGGGIVCGDHLMIGDNSAGGEINRIRNLMYNSTSIEDSCTIRAVQRIYARESGIELKDSPEPKEIYQIGMGDLAGDKKAAKRAFTELAIICGEAAANAITLVDGLVVLGGGLSNAYPLFLKTMVEQMNRRFETMNGYFLDRLETETYNLQDYKGLQEFLKDESHTISVPFSDQRISYDPTKKIGVGVSVLGTSNATSIGAYEYAIQQLDKRKE
ncbi:MAG: ROK family protein [Hyphomicrobiales bacterium]